MTALSYPTDTVPAAPRSWRQRRRPERVCLSREVTEIVSPDVFPCPSPQTSGLAALGRLWKFRRAYERARSWDDWAWVSRGAPPGRNPVERVTLPRAGGFLSFQHGEAWSVNELTHRAIIWHLTQDLPGEAGWAERWTALAIPAGRQVYVVRNFGSRLGLV